MVINFSLKYPKGHSMAGQPTKFPALIGGGKKLHTIRKSAARFEHAAKVADKPGQTWPVKLHLYTGARSKKAKCFLETWYTGSQTIVIDRIPGTNDLWNISVDGADKTVTTWVDIVTNDGFATAQAFVEWMFLGEPAETTRVTLYLIHWTSLRY